MLIIPNTGSTASFLFLYMPLSVVFSFAAASAEGAAVSSRASNPFVTALFLYRAVYFRPPTLHLLVSQFYRPYRFLAVIPRIRTHRLRGVYFTVHDRV
jgi:hypothetical protein